MPIGSELRDFPRNAAYLVPPNGITEHANLNLSKDGVDWRVYVARGRGNNNAAPATSAAANTTFASAAGSDVPAAAVPGAGGGSRSGRGRGENPNIVRDRTSLEAANVSPHPLH